MTRLAVFRPLPIVPTPPIDPKVVDAIEERLAMMDDFTPAQRKARRRQWAAEIVAAVPALRGDAK